MNQYYVRKTETGKTYELCQTRFRGTQESHPHNVCAVGRSQGELRGMYEEYFSGGVDWMVAEGEIYSTNGNPKVGVRILSIDLINMVVTYERIDNGLRATVSYVEFLFWYTPAQF